jgi:hypothetical protein
VKADSDPYHSSFPACRQRNGFIAGFFLGVSYENRIHSFWQWPRYAHAFQNR